MNLKDSITRVKTRRRNALSFIAGATEDQIIVWESQSALSLEALYGATGSAAG